MNPAAKCERAKYFILKRNTDEKNLLCETNKHKKTNVRTHK